MFVYIDDDLDQFAIMMNICIVLGLITTILFMCVINEPKLIADSREIWNKHLLGEELKEANKPMGDLDTPALLPI